MRPSAARDLLLAITDDFSDEKKIVDALVSVKGELTRKQLDAAVTKIAKSYHWTLLFKAARKAVHEAAESVAKGIARHRKDDLRAAFFVQAEDPAAAATFIVDVARSGHLPGMLKRFPKIPTSKVLFDAAAATLGGKPKRAWFEDNFLPCCALIALLVSDGRSGLVDKIEAGLSKQLADHDIWQPSDTINRIRKALGAAEKKVAAKSPVIDLAAAQGFSVPKGKAWTARIWLAKNEPNEWFGAMQTETQLLLQLDSDKKPHWQITVRAAKGHDSFSARNGKVSQNDFGLPKPGKLEDFPGWLSKAGKKLKTSFDPATAKISAGRYRKLVKELRAWLASGSP